MNPTILIFLKAPVAGQVKTRLARDVGDEAALEIYRRLVERQLSAFPPDWPVEVHFSPANAADVMKAWLGESSSRSFWPQVVDGLGERLSYATREAFSRGARSVMLIGGDCPQLGVAEFEQADRVLKEKDVVLGPSEDGGYYLLGFSVPHLALFKDVAWSTSSVAARTREIIAERGLSHSELAVLRDVDKIHDWESIRDLR